MCVPSLLVSERLAPGSELDVGLSQHNTSKLETRSYILQSVCYRPGI